MNSIWSFAVSCPCTGVSVGCSLVNSVSKLLTSPGAFYKKLSIVFIEWGINTHDLREVWGRDTLVEDIIPVDVLEEWVSLDVECIIWAGPKSTSWVSCEQLGSRY